MKPLWSSLLIFVLLPVCSLLSAGNQANDSGLKLVVMKQLDSPVLTIHSAGAEGNKYGFEGGRVLKVEGAYHLFTSEMVGDPHWVKMKLAYWVSQDRVHWRRIGTLLESTGDFTGKDPRASLWSPMPIYDAKNERWNLFYVAYRAAPDTAHEWRTNFDGQIWRAISKKAGPGGIGGPYEDAGVILQPGKDSDPWEGLQGTDSFFPYRIGDTWWAFYGSAHTETLPISLWQVGLASAPTLAGPWTRVTKQNPLKIEPQFIENPIVSRLADGAYVAVYDTKEPESIGYSFSSDGVHWSAGQHLVVQKGAGVWSDDVRTPLGLIEEGKNNFTIFYTANERKAGKRADGNGITLSPGAVGFVEVKLNRTGHPVFATNKRNDSFREIE